MDERTIMNMNQNTPNQPNVTYMGIPSLVEERAACGVGFIADVKGKGSHKLIQQTLTALSCMEHRGGCSADNDSGDGSGVMTAIPRELLSSWFAEKDNCKSPD